MNRAVLLVALLVMATPARAQQATSAPRLELYGFAQGDFGYDVKQNDPDWYDVNRPTKLPASAEAFGRDGRMFASVRQSRFGVRASVPAGTREVRTAFEFDMFGVGVDAGQTTIRLRQAYGQLGHFGAGQLESPFMDGDVFPNTLDYWGPSGMLLFRNVQVFWQPLQGTSRFTVALERPGASGDAGVYAVRVQLENVQLRFPVPDVSAEYRRGTAWGYVEAAGMLRRIQFDDLLDDAFDLEGSETGWGLSVSSNVKPTPKDVLRLQCVYGHGIQNYFNDAPVDVAAENNFSNPVTPIVGKALPITGVTAFLDHTWNARWSSTGGYSLVDVDNTNGQTADDFRRGQYVIANLVHHPAPGVMVGGEFQWARRANFADGFEVNDYRVQLSVRFNFSAQVVRTP